MEYAYELHYLVWPAIIVLWPGENENFLPKCQRKIFFPLHWKRFFVTNVFNIAEDNLLHGSRHGINCILDNYTYRELQRSINKTTFCLPMSAKSILGVRVTSWISNETIQLSWSRHQSPHVAPEELLATVSSVGLQLFCPLCKAIEAQEIVSEMIREIIRDKYGNRIMINKNLIGWWS